MPKLNYADVFPGANPLALDLLDKLLAFNPAKRITVAEAIRHPYLVVFHDPDDEPLAGPMPADFFDFDRNKETLSRDQLKEMIYREVMASP